MKRFFSERKLNIICSAAAIILMWLVWVIVYYSVKNDYVIPSFTDSAAGLWNCLKSSSFWIAFLNTFARTVIAFLISFALAALLSIPAVLSKAFYSLVKPVMVLLRTLPTLAITLILLAWTTPKIAPVIVTVLILFPMIYSQIIAAAGGIDEGLKQMAEVYCLSKRDRIFKIYIPLISPNVLSQTGANVSLGLKVTISAEVLALTYNSIGGLMQNANFYADMPRLAALTIVSVFLGLILDIAFSQLERLTFKWNKKEGKSD